MFIEKISVNKLGVFAVILLLFVLTECAFKKNVSESALPKDILGINVGLSKDEAEKRLNQIGQMQREEQNRQQVWLLKKDAHYGYLALGYGEDNRVNYVAAIAKPKGGEPVFYKNIGDLSAAKREITGPNYRYTWTVSDEPDESDLYVIAQGKNAEFLSLLTISKSLKPESEVEENEREERR